MTVRYNRNSRTLAYSLARSLAIPRRSSSGTRSPHPLVTCASKRRSLALAPFIGTRSSPRPSVYHCFVPLIVARGRHSVSFVRRSASLVGSLPRELGRRSLAPLSSSSQQSPGRHPIRFVLTWSILSSGLEPMIRDWNLSSHRHSLQKLPFAHPVPLRRSVQRRTDWEQELRTNPI